MRDEEEQMGFTSFITDFNMKEVNEDIDRLPILPLRNMVVFPNVVMPVSVKREKSIRLIRDVYAKDKLMGVVTQRKDSVEDPRQDDLFCTGTFVRVIRILEMPDSSVTAIIEARKRFSLLELTEEMPFLVGKVQLLADEEFDENTRENKALKEAVRDMAVQVINNSSVLPNEMVFEIKNSETFLHLLHFVCSNFPLKVPAKQRLLEMEDVEKRAYSLLKLLSEELQLLDIKNMIQSKARLEIDQQQKEYFLHQQMKAIKGELGDDDDLHIEKLKSAAKHKKWDKKTAAFFKEELSKLERLNPSSPDYSVQLSYLECLLKLPWNEYTKDKLDIKSARKILDRDHFGIEVVKERILEYLSVLKMKGDMKSPILCLYGPPGVGKTSLGKSIAESLNRKYVRMSLGGMHDEAEIRGHRRTYIGAMPGRVIQSIQKAQSSNPVFVLDEIDKINSDFHGDPSSALLEVLDPEQNSAFHDNYLDVDYDLSKVLFIATANNISSIPRPLLDRMELIEVTGYIQEEKVEIASRHLIPKQMENHGVPKKSFTISKAAINKIVESYTRESGVRELDRKIAKLMRRAVRRIASDEPVPKTIKPEHLKDFLGSEEYFRDSCDSNEVCGVVNGLAWTAVGGEVLVIETAMNKVKSGGKLSLTGNLGDVMKESAVLAMEYIKSHADDLGINPELFDTRNVHVHVPEGAIPKDGPSAGITMTTALVSSFTGRKVKKNIAMTGEVTLQGRVLPVGGIKEKILAAKRAGIKTIILCEKNRKDIEEIKADYLKGVDFKYVTNVKEVIDLALRK